MFAHLLDELLGNACTLPRDDLLNQRLDVGFDGHDLHGTLGCAIQRNYSDGAGPAVQFPPCFNPPVDLLVPGFRYAIDPIAQRPEQEDVVQGPACGVRCQAAGSEDEPCRPHGPRVGRSDHAHHGKARAIDLRPAVGRVPFGLGQQGALRDVSTLGALIQRLSLARHVAIHPTIERFERQQQAAQGQIADRRHAVRLPGGERSSIVGGRRNLGAGACRTLWRSIDSCLCHLSEPPVNSPSQGE